VTSRALSCFVLFACGGTTAPAPKVIAIAPPVVTSAPPIDAGPAAPRWTIDAPADAHVDSKGCEMPASRMSVALSVDGTAAGVFLEHMSGDRGTVTIDPSGPSSAHVTFGAATFDARVALESSPLRFPRKPPPIGGILRPARHVLAYVTGGDAARLRLTLADREGIFEWASPPTSAFDCTDFSAAPATWDDEFPRDDLQTYMPKDERLSVRATRGGDVVARVRVKRVSVMKREKGAVAISAWTPLGLVVGWADSADLVEAAPVVREGSGTGIGGAMGRMRPRKVVCAPGSPLFVLKNERLTRVGRLHDDTDEPSSHDWRVGKDGRVSLDVAPGQSSTAYAVLEDDFRVTNWFWHQGVSGQFVVPLDAKTCALEPR
jgi:hypothetical protein